MRDTSVQSSEAHEMRLWDRAYESFASKHADLDRAFRDILSAESDSSPSLIASKSYAERERQLSALVSRQVERMESREWKIQLGSKTIKIRKQVERILQIISAIKDVGTQAASLDPVHAGLPVAALYLILSFVTKDKDNRDSLFDGLESISDVVRRYAAIEKVYIDGTGSQTQEVLNESILKVYERIFEFEARALCQFHHNIAFQTLKSIFGGNSWRDMLVGISNADTLCTRLLPTLDAENEAQNSQKLSAILTKQTEQIQRNFQQANDLTEALLEEMQIARNDQKFWEEVKLKRELMTLLRTTDFEFSKNKNPKRSSGTCEWFLQHHGYQQWLRQHTASCLWLTADPGCGKSVLSRCLVDAYTEISSEDTTICYFFFKAGQENESAQNALCALLFQIFEQNDDLLTKFGLPEYRKGGNLAGLFEPLWRLFVAICHDRDRPQIVFILDALDECAVSHRRVLATRIAELCTDSTSMRLRVLITSRPDIGLRDAFDRGSNSNALFIRLSGENEQEMEAITNEINVVIDEEISRFRETRERNLIEDDMHQILRTEINKVENRTYLWVSLIFPEIQDNAVCEQDELLEIFRTLPHTVEEAYESMLKKITNVEKARKLLSIIMVAKRALTLTELKIAFSIEQNGNYGKIDELPKHNTHKPGDIIGPIEASFRESVRQLCGLFIRTTGSRVYLIHQTAQEFLQATKDLRQTTQSEWKHSFSKADSNRLLAQSCIWYLMLPKFDEQWLKYSKERWKPSGRTLTEFASDNPFVDYAAIHWTVHFNASDVAETDELATLATTLCSTDTHRFRTWAKIYWSSFNRSMPRAYTDLLGAASFDLVQVIHILLLRGQDVSQVDEDGDSALHGAAISNHVRAATEVLEWNAPVDLKAKDGNTPLHAAAGWGSKPVMELLLSHGADKESRNGDGRTPLHRAAQFGHVEAAKVLIQAGADVNAVDAAHQSALHLAARGGGGSPRTAEGAAKLQSKSMIELLIRAGADPRLVDQGGKIAAHFAGDGELESFFSFSSFGPP